LHNNAYIFVGTHLRSKQHQSVQLE